MKTPMWFSAAGVTVNVVGSLAMFPHLGHVGIAIATSLAGWVNAALLGASLWRRRDFRPSLVTLRRVLLIFIGNALMGGLVWMALWRFGAQMLDADLLVRLTAVALTVAVAIVIYFGFVLATGAIERDRLMALLRRRPRG